MSSKCLSIFCGQLQVFLLLSQKQVVDIALAYLSFSYQCFAASDMPLRKYRSASHFSARVLSPIFLRLLLLLFNLL